ncbi:MAG: thermonuclease family protein [Hyphomonadaceae bacterium]|nr:thermonuclease family protein [Hyphomonadaceae bacterium]
MRVAARIGALIAAAALAACGPDFGALEPGEKGRVARVFDGDTLALDTGLRVTLTEIEAPYGDEPFAAQARAGLEQMALERPARLAYGGARRYAPRTRPAKQGEAPAEAPAETALAHVYVQSEGGRWIWLQGAMVEQGLAFARPRKENHARTQDLFAAEERARAAGRGLWGERAYRVRTPAQLVAEVETLPPSCRRGPFRVVEGVVRSVSASDDRAYLNFGDDYRTDFTIAIYEEDISSWRESGPDFQSFQGQSVRARGRVGARGGPLMCLDHPAQITIAAAR